MEKSLIKILFVILTLTVFSPSFSQSFKGETWIVQNPNEVDEDSESLLIVYSFEPDGSLWVSFMNLSKKNSEPLIVFYNYEENSNFLNLIDKYEQDYFRIEWINKHYALLTNEKINSKIKLAKLQSKEDKFLQNWAKKNR